MALAPFAAAYRPHERAHTWRELRAMGCEPLPAPEPALEEIKRQASFLDKFYYGFLETVHRDEHGRIADVPAE